MCVTIHSISIDHKYIEREERRIGLEGKAAATGGVTAVKIGVGLVGL